MSATKTRTVTRCACGKRMSQYSRECRACYAVLQQKWQTRIVDANSVLARVTATPTYWDRYMSVGTLFPDDKDVEKNAGSSRALGLLATGGYNETVTGLAPIDRVGTEAYFKAIMSALRREGESRSWSAERERVDMKARQKVNKLRAKLNGASTSYKPRVERATSDNLFPQRCHNCARLMQDEPVKALRDFPAAFCLPCWDAPRKDLLPRTVTLWDVEDARIAATNS